MKRLALKSCQCGGHAAWVRCVGGRRGEALRCPKCGNRTGQGRSRERLAEEWNSAGWCGQGAAEYTPFGPEWKEQCLRMRKPALVELLERACRRGLCLDGLVARLRGELGAADRLIARLRMKRNRRDYAAIIDRLVQRGVIERADAAGAKRRIAEGGEA